LYSGNEEKKILHHYLLRGSTLTEEKYRVTRSYLNKLRKKYRLKSRIEQRLTEKVNALCPLCGSQLIKTYVFGEHEPFKEAYWCETDQEAFSEGVIK